jgi:uncharacterized membrane protein
MNSVKTGKNYIRETFVNGVIFLVPVTVIIVLFSGVISGAFSFFISMQKNNTVQKFGGLPVLLLAALMAVVGVVFLVGVLIRFTFFRGLNAWLENQVLGMVPGYDLYKTMMEEKLHIKHPGGKAVLVQWRESQQLGVQIERNGNGTCTVYFSNASLTGGGTIHIVPQNQIIELDMPLSKLFEITNKFGDGLGEYCTQKRGVGVE